MPSATTPVLIAGAGPTGLILAMSLARRNVPFRILSEAAGPGEHSRAVAVHARTLEFYRQFGFADRIVEAGIASDKGHLREGSHGGDTREIANSGLRTWAKASVPFRIFCFIRRTTTSAFCWRGSKNSGSRSNGTRL